MMPCPRENRGSLDALSWGCHVTAPCEEVMLVVAGSPHLPIRHNKTSEPSSGWLNNSSLLLHSGDGATVTCVNSNPSHNIVCTPQAGTQGYIVSKKICSLCLNSNMSCAVLAVLLCLLQQVSDMEPPHLLHPLAFLSLRWACLLQSVMLSGRR